MDDSETLRGRLLSGVLAGLVGGLLYGMLGGEQQLPLLNKVLVSWHPGLWLAEHVLIGAMIGAGFGALLGRVVNTAGSGLMWGEMYALACWIAGPLTIFPLFESRADWTAEAARLVFPALLGYMVAYGAVLGLAYSAVSAVLAAGLRGMISRITPGLVGAAIIGGMAGLIGGLAFGAWMERVGFFPLIAALVGSVSPRVGRTLHFVISVIIGASYGIFFRHDIRGPGSSVAWGLGTGSSGGLLALSPSCRYGWVTAFSGPWRRHRMPFRPLWAI